MVKTEIHLVANVKIKVNDEVQQEVHNIVVTTGLAYIAARLKDDSIPTQMSHMGVGIGTTAAALTDTAIETPEGARVAFTSITATDSEIEYVGIFDGATYSGAALTEAGIFNDLTAGTMLAHVIFAPIILAAEDTMSITWTHQFANV